MASSTAGRKLLSFSLLIKFHSEQFENWGNIQPERRKIKFCIKGFRNPLSKLGPEAVTVSQCQGDIQQIKFESN